MSHIRLKIRNIENHERNENFYALRFYNRAYFFVSFVLFDVN